ncbi:MAG: hypothetical protein Q9221_008292 [Calogaya cf. arnoldii]
MEFPQPDGDLALKVKARVVTTTVIGYASLALSKLQEKTSTWKAALHHTQNTLEASAHDLVIQLGDMDSLYSDWEAYSNTGDGPAASPLPEQKASADTNQAHRRAVKNWKEGPEMAYKSLQSGAPALILSALKQFAYYLAAGLSRLGGPKTAQTVNKYLKHFVAGFKQATGTEIDDGRKNSR